MAESDDEESDELSLLSDLVDEIEVRLSLLEKQMADLVHALHTGLSGESEK